METFRNVRRSKEAAIISRREHEVETSLVSFLISDCCEGIGILKTEGGSRKKGFVSITCSAIGILKKCNDFIYYVRIGCPYFIQISFRNSKQAGLERWFRERILTAS